MLAVEVNPEASVDEWETFVDNHPEGTYYHLPQWQAVIKAGLGYKPAYVFVRNEDGELCGILPLFLVGSALTGCRLVSLPFANACGPLADSSETIEALVNRAKGLCDEMRCRYLEIRTKRPRPLGPEVSEFFHAYILEIPESRMVWERADRQARWTVGKAGREGVTVRVDDSDRGLETFCDLNLRNKKGHGVPTHSSNLFRAMRKRMKGRFRLYLAEVEGKVVAGAIEIGFNGVTDYGYAASDTSYMHHYPNTHHHVAGNRRQLQ